MCFEFDARPPDLPADLPRLAGAASAEVLELTSADGTAFSAAFAEAPGSDAAGVAILPDVRGLYRFYIELAERFAQAGHPAIALDYFGRTAGTGERAEDFDYMPHVMQTRLDQVQDDAAAAIATLHERAGGRPVATVGFCFGGTQSLLANTSQRLDLAGAVGFYAGLDTSRWGIASPAERAEKMRAPLLGLFGGEDQGIPVEQVEHFEQRLEEAGVEKEIVIYPGAPHSFFDRKQDQFAAECEDAWRRVLAFLGGLTPA